MARVFTIPTVLRMVPASLLKMFFARFGVLQTDLDWERLSSRRIDPLVQAVYSLPAATFDAVESALHAVFDLACETGINAVLEAGVSAGDDNLPGRLPQEGGPYHKVLWTWLYSAELFHRALLLHQFERLPWWRKRTGLPVGQPDTSPEKLQLLQRTLSQGLLQEQGRGKVCTVETLYRRGTDYIFAHPDDYVQNVAAHDAEGRLSGSSFRPTFDIVFAYRREEGSLELFAGLPAKWKPRLEALFAGIFLGVELPADPPRAAYNLGGLKDRRFAPVTDPGDAVRVRIRRLRLAFKNSRRRLLLEADPDAGVDDIHDMLEEVLDRRHVPLSSVNVTLVTFCFEFLPVDGRKAGSLTFDVAYPNSCSLRNQRPERIELALKYLKQWRIDVEPGLPETVPAA